MAPDRRALVWDVDEYEIPEYEDGAADRVHHAYPEIVEPCWP